MFETKQITPTPKKNKHIILPFIPVVLALEDIYLSDLMNLNSTKCVIWEQMIMNNSCVLAYSITNKRLFQPPALLVSNNWNLNG